MDDSQRPDVPIRMDMPGWSDTYGYYSQARLTSGTHAFLVKLDGHYNRSLAEMTMYPNNPTENEMFMLTWPDVRTLNSGFYLEDRIKMGQGSLRLSTRMVLQNSHVADALGLGSLRIFYPEMERSTLRFLKSTAVQFHKKQGAFHLHTGISFADRGPSVSEGYGFYLFNSFDAHDYIGNPDLENEKALEANMGISLKKKGFNMGITGNYFHMTDYIIGEVDTTLDVMTLGANGVKVYKNLDSAHLYNISWDMEYEPFEGFKWSGFLSYHRGADMNGRNLPFISPVAYRSNIQFTQGKFSGFLSMDGAGQQNDFSPEFGEDKTKAYTVFSLSLGRTFTIEDDAIYVKLGVENMFDKYYSTYTDWKNIPRMGRNFFITASYAIN